MTDSAFPTRRRALRWTSPILAGALVFGAAACSKTETTSTTPSTQAAPAATAGGGGGGGGGATDGTTKGTAPAAVDLDGTKVWYEGYTFELGEVSLDTAESSLTIATDITNLSRDNSTVYTTAVLQSDGKQIAQGTVDGYPNIVGGKTVAGKLVFTNVPEDIDLSETTLVFGGSGKQEASVPLSGEGPVVSLEPITQQEFVAPIVMGPVTVDVKVSQVRFDLPDHTQADAGKAYFVLGGTVKNSSDGTVYLSVEGLTITDSSGEEYTATSIEPSSVAASQSDDKGAVVFGIDWPASGTWTLNLQADWDGDGTPDTHTSTGTISESSSGGTTATTRAG